MPTTREVVDIAGTVVSDTSSVNTANRPTQIKSGYEYKISEHGPMRMSVRVGVGPPHLWSVVRKMHLKRGAKPRPDTATLDRPIVLDPQLLRKVDMTRLTRDRLLTIENLISSPRKTRASPRPKEKSGRPLPKSKSREEKLDDWVDQKSIESEDFPKRKNSTVINSTFRVRSHVRKGLREVFSSQAQNQSAQSKEKIIKSPKLKESREKKAVEDVFGSLIVSDAVPSPCSTCGRSERPERLHAHPSVPQNKRSKLKEDQENTGVAIQKSSVTKPVAMKFRSGKARERKSEMERASSLSEQMKSPPKEKEQKRVPLIRSETFKIDRESKNLLLEKKMSPSPSHNRKGSLAHSIPRRQALPRTPDKQSPRAISPVPPPIPVPSNPPVVHSASPRRPRTITCYLCQKQFGTASYPLHEPQCLQKWHRENQALPSSQQQETPRRPDSVVWENAWEAAQAAMVACDGCSKTFLPHRLEAHQRVCPASSNNNSSSSSSSSSSPYKKLSPPRLLQDIESDKEDGSERSVLLEGPTSIHCHICGRVFNRAAIDRHEQQCLRRWQLEHSRDSGSSAPASATSSPPSSAPSTPRRRHVLCYLCGRQFGSASIAIHEPQCLRRWRQENERLPAAQRRAEPSKPDVVYDSEGHVDHQATAEAQWQCHLIQLVPCGKCGRTFNPDRISVHEKCCKGPIKH